MLDKKPKLKVDKKKKGINKELFEKTQPIRDVVSEAVFNENADAEELAYVQSELRRLSRVVKKARKAT